MIEALPQQSATRELPKTESVRSDSFYGVVDDSEVALGIEGAEIRLLLDACFNQPMTQATSESSSS